MVRWKELLGFNSGNQRYWRDETQRFLPPSEREACTSAIPPLEVTRVALRLRYLIEETIPCELEEDQVTKAQSRIITRDVVKAAKQAGGKDHQACVVYALLVNKRWFKKQASIELWDADLHNLRAIACETISKKIIESEENTEYLLHDILLKRYSIIVDGEPTPPANVIERAVDLHALQVTGSSGYQKCVNHLWRGWLVQDENDPSTFVDYKLKHITTYWTHVDPDRMRAPVYQNATQIIFSVIYLGLFTAAINTVNPTGDLDFTEILLYLFTLGFICDEFSKLWKVGRNFVSFWNVFNVTLYTLLAVSFVTRCIALSHPLHDHGLRQHYNVLSYNFLAFSAPMFWMRLLLYLDSIRFFGAMLVVLKVMMKESLIFFALLFFILIGFLQAFVGMDAADNRIDATKFIIQSMANAIMQSPDFSGFDHFAPPFGIILYYIFTFITMVVLLNILIALYNSAYEDITDNALDEYMALFAQKTMQFVRAPDENVFIAPLNLVEIFFLIIPLEWWMSRRIYAKVNDYVMAALYSPLLFVAAWFEKKSALRVECNRQRGEDDDDHGIEEWEQMANEMDVKGEGWDKTVKQAVPDVENDQATCEVRRLRREIEELKEMVQGLLDSKRKFAREESEATL